MISRKTSGLLARTGMALYKRTPAQVSEFIVHYGDAPTPKTVAEETRLLQAYDRHHAAQGWGGIGYNLAVGPVSGSVYEARGLDRVGAHTTGHNTKAVGVVLIGGNDALTPKAKQGLRDAYTMSTVWAQKPLTVAGHRDYAPTSCPGDALYAWLKTGEIKGARVNPPGTYIMEQGKKVPPGTNYYYQRMRQAFKKATGDDLLITSGLRTYAEQKDLYDRWTGRPGGPIKKPYFYSPDVAKPGTSLHETGRALDLRDSGTLPGVTVKGTRNSNWMRDNAPKFGFDAVGLHWNAPHTEPWHFELQPHLDPWNAPNQSTKGFLMALTDKQQKQLFARVQTIQDILTGYKENPYVQKGASLPLVGARVRDIKDYISGGGPKGDADTLLREILSGQDEILARLDALEEKAGN